jgi:hypothetical protein
MSIVYGGGFTVREHIQALQQRNTTTLLQALGSADNIEADFETIEDDEFKRGKVVLNRTIQKIINYSGVGDIIPISQFSRVGGAIDRAQSRLFRDVRRSLSHIFMPLEVYAKEAMFQYEQKIVNNYIGSAIGGFIGSAIGYYYFGPVGAMALEGFFGYIGATVEKAIKDPQGHAQDVLHNPLHEGLGIPVPKPLEDAFAPSTEPSAMMTLFEDLSPYKAPPNLDPTFQFYAPNPQYAIGKIDRVRYNLYTGGYQM